MYETTVVDPAELDSAQTAKLIDLVNAAFRRHHWLFPVDRIDAAGFAEQTADKRLLLLRVRDEVVAMAAFDTSAAALHFGMAVVEPALHGQGVGRALLAALEAHARAAGCTCIDIETVEEIGNADYYRRRGYTVTGHETRPVGTWGALQPFTLVQMRKQLGHGR